MKDESVLETEVFTTYEKLEKRSKELLIESIDKKCSNQSPISEALAIISTFNIVILERMENRTSLEDHDDVSAVIFMTTFLVTKKLGINIDEDQITSKGISQILLQALEKINDNDIVDTMYVTMLTGIKAMQEFRIVPSGAMDKLGYKLVLNLLERFVELTEKLFESYDQFKNETGQG